MTITHELIGGSVWQQALYRHLTTHVESEKEMLIAYQQAATDSQSRAFRYLASLILEDEERHHRLFAEMAQTLESEADERQENPAIPPLGNWGYGRGHIVKLTGDLLAQENADAKELQDLVLELEVANDDTMWQLLVRIMQADTRKHIEILEFVRGHAGETDQPV